MVIVYCVDQIEASGGIERVTVTKANALAEIPGNIVYIVVAYHRKDRLGLSSKVKLIDLKVPYYGDIGKSKIAMYLYILGRILEHKKKMHALLNSISPDIVVSTGNYEKLFLAKLRIRSHPVIIREIHFVKNYRLLDARNAKETVIAKIREVLDYGLSINKYDKIVVLTKEDKEKNWKNSHKVLVVPNPITRISKELSTLDNKTVITVGRLVFQKNFQSLISAWSQVEKIHPDWRLEIYGEGPLKDKLQNQIDELGLSKSILLKGYSNDIMQCMTDSSLFVLSSIYEGFALVLLEAMNCGLPLVAYSCPCGTRDIIQEGRNGFLVPLNDEGLLAERIGFLIDNEAERRRMGKIAYDMSQSYTIDHIIEKWMTLFRTLILEKRGSEIVQ